MLLPIFGLTVKYPVSVPASVQQSWRFWKSIASELGCPMKSPTNILLPVPSRFDDSILG